MPALLAVGALASTGCQPEPVPAAPPQQSVAPLPQPLPETAPVSSVVPFTMPPPAYTGQLPPIPSSPYPVPRPSEVIQAVYTFAARHPEVLHYVPCFCGCQQSGHSNNDDCFIKSRDAKGRPTWDDHGMT